MKRLSELIECCYDDVFITGIKCDSRDVLEGDLFVAVCGFFTDHFQYIEDAIKRGAVCVVSDRKVEYDVISIVVDDVNLCYNELLKKFYDDIELDFRLIGITGTDGKTTTTTIISKILDECCYVGTNGFSYGDLFTSLDNTTPDIGVIYTIMNRLKSTNCRTMAMEVSSEALLHNRVSSLQYDIVGFTNITEDHLNIHGTIENYIDSKSKLLDMLKDSSVAIFNIDDINIRKIVKKCRGKYYTFGVNDDSDFRIRRIKSTRDGVSYSLIFDGNKYVINSSLMGVYNVYNLTLAFIVCYIMGVDVNTIINRIREINFIVGRGEKLDFGQDYTIILDYAHTAEGIFSVLSNIRKVYKNYKIISVSGSAGGREKAKRSKMGKMLFKYSDYVIFTMDDPRYEDVDVIIDGLIGKSKSKKYKRIIDRGKAIRYALDMADEGCVVVILGKGRDNYMAVGNMKVKYSDYDVICKYFLGGH